MAPFLLSPHPLTFAWNAQQVFTAPCFAHSATWLRVQGTWGKGKHRAPSIRNGETLPFPQEAPCAPSGPSSLCPRPLHFPDLGLCFCYFLDLESRPQNSREGPANTLSSRGAAPPSQCSPQRSPSWSTAPTPYLTLLWPVPAPGAPLRLSLGVVCTQLSLPTGPGPELPTQPTSLVLGPRPSPALHGHSQL